MPQGSILSPLLFIIYINDLPAVVLDISITMYTDDTEIGRSFTSVTEIKQHLMPAFSKVYEWLKCNKLSSNTVKTEFMVFGTNNRLNQLGKSPVTTPYTSCFYNFEIKRVKHTKYLGLTVDDTLTWDKHDQYKMVIYNCQKLNSSVLKDPFLIPHSHQKLSCLKSGVST